MLTVRAPQKLHNGLVVNPGFLTKGNEGGNYARVAVYAPRTADLPVRGAIGVRVAWGGNLVGRGAGTGQEDGPRRGQPRGRARVARVIGG